MSSLAFLSPGPGAVAKSPMEPGAVSSGATFEERDGWKVAVSFPNESSSVVGFADLSHIGKLEIQGDVRAMTGRNLELGKATRADGAWWCPYSANRAVVLCPAGDTVAHRDHLTASVADANGLVTSGPIPGEAQRIEFSLEDELPAEPAIAGEHNREKSLAPHETSYGLSVIAAEPIIVLNSASLRMAVPSCCAFSSLLPASAPATR